LASFAVSRDTIYQNPELNLDDHHNADPVSQMILDPLFRGYAILSIHNPRIDGASSRRVKALDRRNAGVSD
jgi:hypothetical protein